MVENKLELLVSALSRVDREAVRIAEGVNDGLYLYVKIGEGWVDPSLFKDEGAAISYIDKADLEFAEAIIDAWCLEPEDKRWTGMEYMIDGGKFDAKFQFDDLDAYDGSDDRRQQFLRARYGDRPIRYPPPREGMTELTAPA